MIDAATPDGRILAAALRLAAERDWSKVVLRDIAEAAGMTLAGLSEHVASKSDILKLYARHVDAEMLKRAPRPEPGESPRDQLFEVVMSRFDVMAPDREALRSMLKSPDFDPSLLTTFLKSQSWMLEAAGIDADGIEGNIKAAGLASIYGSILRTWLDDDDPGMAKTMAVLDRRLRRGERAMETVDSVLSACSRLTGFFRPGRTASRDGRSTGDDEAGGPVPPAGAPDGPTPASGPAF